MKFSKCYRCGTRLTKYHRDIWLLILDKSTKKKYFCSEQCLSQFVGVEVSYEEVKQ